MDNIRIVKTARDKKSINEAASKGLQPLLKKVVPSSEIRSKYAVIQNKKSGEITVTNDYRIFHNLKENPDLVTVIDWTEYYPHNFASPFAAYLIPKDIQIGERVFIEDLIEDYKDYVKVKSIESEIGANQWQILQHLKTVQQMVGAPQTRMPIFVVKQP